MLLLICNRELMFILSEKHRQDNAPQGCTTILIGIMSTELTRIVCQLSRARFDYKRKDEDDMAKSTKTYEERIRALEKKEQESIEATKKLIAQRKELEKRKKAEESKKRTHRLCQIGGAVESVLGCPIEEEDLPKLIGFLKRQETNGKFFSKAMQKEPFTDMEEV